MMLMFLLPNYIINKQCETLKITKGIEFNVL
jgi:hypothetical protein